VAEARRKAEEAARLIEGKHNADEAPGQRRSWGWFRRLRGK
jgi:hypothetical protein